MDDSRRSRSWEGPGWVTGYTLGCIRCAGHIQPDIGEHAHRLQGQIWCCGCWQEGAGYLCPWNPRRLGTIPRGAQLLPPGMIRRLAQLADRGWDDE